MAALLRCEGHADPIVASDRAQALLWVTALGIWLVVHVRRDLPLTFALLVMLLPVNT